ncbi:MAG: PEF-CTERM sorting domain-containing protein [ANME-2 cluster archaeon]|nr:MAG: PEF-CTERM sorting domain-containing protein [ANME-2 cluster archaeon]
MSMKKKISIVLCIFMLLIMMNGMAMAAPSHGAVFAVDSAGNDVNLPIGTPIYINGHTLAGSADFHWYIYDMNPPCTDQGPGIGCGNLMDEGTGTTNSAGEISLLDTGFTIPVDTYHYKLYVVIGPNIEPYAEYYSKVDTFEGVGVAIPEFPSIALPIATIVGLMFLFQIRKRKTE